MAKFELMTAASGVIYPHSLEAETLMAARQVGISFGLVTLYDKLIVRPEKGCFANLADMTQMSSSRGLVFSKLPNFDSASYFGKELYGLTKTAVEDYIKKHLQVKPLPRDDATEKKKIYGLTKEQKAQIKLLGVNFVPALSGNSLKVEPMSNNRDNCPACIKLLKAPIFVGNDKYYLSRPDNAIESKTGFQSFRSPASPALHLVKWAPRHECSTETFLKMFKDRRELKVFFHMKHVFNHPHLHYIMYDRLMITTCLGHVHMDSFSVYIMDAIFENFKNQSLSKDGKLKVRAPFTGCFPLNIMIDNLDIDYRWMALTQIYMLMLGLGFPVSSDNKQDLLAKLYFKLLPTGIFALILKFVANYERGIILEAVWAKKLKEEYPFWYSCMDVKIFDTTEDDKKDIPE